MALMNKRATYALDEETIQRIKELAALMHVSQAEVVRRAVAPAEEKLKRLESYHQRGGLTEQKAEEYLDEVRDNPGCINYKRSVSSLHSHPCPGIFTSFQSMWSQTHPSG
jgi:hypothetical protein